MVGNRAWVTFRSDGNVANKLKSLIANTLKQKFVTKKTFESYAALSVAAQREGAQDIFLEPAGLASSALVVQRPASQALVVQPSQDAAAEVSSVMMCVQLRRGTAQCPMLHFAGFL